MDSIQGIVGRYQDAIDDFDIKDIIDFNFLATSVHPLESHNDQITDLSFRSHNSSQEDQLNFHSSDCHLQKIHTLPSLTEVVDIAWNQIDSQNRNEIKAKDFSKVFAVIEYLLNNYCSGLSGNAKKFQFENVKILIDSMAESNQEIPVTKSEFKELFDNLFIVPVLPEKLNQGSNQNKDKYDINDDNKIIPLEFCTPDNKISYTSSSKADATQQGDFNNDSGEQRNKFNISLKKHILSKKGIFKETNALKLIEIEIDNDSDNDNDDIIIASTPLPMESLSDSNFKFVDSKHSRFLSMITNSTSNSKDNKEKLGWNKSIFNRNFHGIRKDKNTDIMPTKTESSIFPASSVASVNYCDYDYNEEKNDENNEIHSNQIYKSKVEGDPFEIIKRLQVQIAQLASQNEKQDVEINHRDKLIESMELRFQDLNEKLNKNQQLLRETTNQNKNTEKYIAEMEKENSQILLKLYETKKTQNDQSKELINKPNNYSVINSGIPIVGDNINDVKGTEKTQSSYQGLIGREETQQKNHDSVIRFSDKYKNQIGKIQMETETNLYKEKLVETLKMLKNYSKEKQVYIHEMENLKCQLQNSIFELHAKPYDSPLIMKKPFYSSRNNLKFKAVALIVVGFVYYFVRVFFYEPNYLQMAEKDGEDDSHWHFI
ncbi:uncharacterized protein ASCRUDRAFT_9213 [Ascoidea rubescens DSM 1968]|uniref:Uncharacterized protein n=1 Tax=Ascoidea rubescens DSM 1968 TaxID=1344418 RepID=A0A1D2VD75_9ASCO|nr:hypothetical protein ASCRUDRAFT_9213 [Ascoidea rubescens DSM 1968]ODV59532.1 hypothetical protein ASCRUDRAFT_9213 [Ascoidea rubescens DSM 1968]